MNTLSKAGVAVAVAAALTGCSAQALPEVDPAAVTGEVVPRQVTWLLSRPADGQVISTFRTIADEYAAQHPGFSLELITTPDRPSYLQKLITLATAGELPDFFDSDGTPYLDRLRDQGRLVDAEAILEGAGVLDDYRPLALDYQRFSDGGLYLLPFEFDAELFFYNEDAFTRAGLEPPTTLDEMVSMCGPLRDAGVTPIALDGIDQWPLERYLSYYPFRETGNEYLSELAAGSARLGDETGLRAATWISDLAAAGCFADGASSATYTDARDLFTTGRAGVYNVGTWELGSLTGPDLGADMRDNIGYFTLPTAQDAVTGPDDFVVGSGIGMAVNAATYDPLVKDFLEFALQRYPEMYAETGRFSPTSDVTPTAPDGSTALYDEIREQLDDLGDTTALPWDTRLDPASNTRLQQELTLLGQGDVTPEEFARAVDGVLEQRAGS